MKAPKRRAECPHHGHPTSRLLALDPRARRFCEAALQHSGRLPEIAQTLQLAPIALDKLIARLRVAGLVRTVTVVAPLAVGMKIECLTLVRLRGQTPDAIDRFEDWCRADPIVACAARICGRFDYQLVSFHSDIRDLHAWRRQLEARAEVGNVDQRRVRTVYGQPFPGLALTGQTEFVRSAGLSGHNEVVFNNCQAGERAAPPAAMIG